jgi:hypothetical protein
MNYDANGAKENIERITEAIFNVLYHEGDMDLRDLKKHVDVPADVFDMAIGALVEKDDVQLLKTGDSFTVHRKDPAPAVFPFRSN